MKASSGHATLDMCSAEALGGGGLRGGIGRHVTHTVVDTGAAMRMFAWLIYVVEIGECRRRTRVPFGLFTCKAVYTLYVVSRVRDYDRYGCM